MKFRLTTILYVFALLAAAMATFGPVVGGVTALVLLAVHWVSPSASAKFGVTLCLLGLWFGYALVPPAGLTPRVPASLWLSIQRLKQLGLSIHNYEATEACLPPPYSTDDQGRPLHSWRTMLLPYLGENAVYQFAEQNGAWDSPSNQTRLHKHKIDHFQTPRVTLGDDKPAETHYLAIVDERTVWAPEEQLNFSHITDGVAQTIVLIEVTDREVLWCEPRDLTMNEAVDLLCGEAKESHEWIRPGFFVSERVRGDGLLPRVVLFADGHVESMLPLDDREIAKALLTRAGGEDVSNWENAEITWKADPNVIGYIIHWGRVWGLAVFLALSVAPFFWKRHETESEAA